MNYHHAYHAGNHADVLKHLVLLASCQALTAKPAACHALDTHAGAGLYHLDDAAARLTAEAATGIERLTQPEDPLLQQYLQAVAACRRQHGEAVYPGSPWLLTHALRAQDRITCCELQAQHANRLRCALGHDRRLAIHCRDGYAAMKALLPPRADQTHQRRGLVLVDPPYQAQLREFEIALSALSNALKRWPQGTYILWYPIKQRRLLQPFYRRATALDCTSSLRCELLVRDDDSPLRMNGSGLLMLNPPWRLERRLQPALAELANSLGERGRGRYMLDHLRAPT